MGKRRDRRLAAQMAAGRRLKLDLFTEPSGDMVGASRHDEVEGDLDQNSHARAPNSPSSPGQQQENPLLLLGQYSDDELEEEDNKLAPSALDSSVDQNELIEELVDIVGDKDCNEGKDIASPGVKQENTDNGVDPLNDVKCSDSNAIGPSDFTVSSNPQNEADPVTEVCVSGICGLQSDQDATGEWKIVMHEESNRYYYWNTLTGETSWEVPDTVVQGMESTGEQKLYPLAKESGSAPVDAHASGSNLNGEVYPNSSSLDEPSNTNFIAGTKEHCESGIEMEMGDVGTKGENGQVLNDNPSSISVSYMEASALGDSVSTQQSSMVICGLEESTTTRKEDPVATDSKEKNEHPIVSNDYAEASHVHSARLMKFGQNLLQRLKVLEGSGDLTQAQDWRLKYILEIEIRLSDCKALASYGPSLLPFWWHTETQLKLLELAIGEEAASRFARHEHSSKVEILQTSLSRDADTSRQSMGTESGKDKGGPSSTIGNAYVPTDIVDTSVVVENQVHHLVNNEDVKTKHDLSSGSPGSEPREIAQEPNEMVPVHAVPKTEPYAGEDADMDVDMEVDYETSANLATSIDESGNAQLEQLIHSNANLPSAECMPSEPLEEFSAPPPPDDEWIPPPPPDNEPIPPPPPDEPPAPLYPPPLAHAELMPPLPCTEQYNLTYPVPTYEYYAPAVTDITTATYYTPTESCQNAEPQPPPYYEPAANVFPEATTAVVNPVEPVVYYDLPNGAVPSGPVIISLESSGFYGESSSVSYHDNAVSDHMGLVGVAPESRYPPLTSLKVEAVFPTSASETDVVAIKTVRVSTAAQTTGATLVNESAVAPLITADSKNQPKVVRSKKRTIAVAPTLRSNRKVSSLVDKWKAAKEELHGEKDDEPDDPLEMLEKKRQRQIEEWRAQQIASGEARDNANFQPLGGDWRERVKRKKAKKTSGETVQTSEVIANEQQQPNLIELSKDLPSGWQAYWDESSKQVYYGNAITSKTTWTRPTR